MPFYPTKKHLRCHYFTHNYQTSWSYDACFLSYGVDMHLIICNFGPRFALLPYWPWKLKFLKNVQASWRYSPFTHVYHKWRYDVCFLRYGLWQTLFFVILGHFLPFYPANNLILFKKKKKKMTKWIFSESCISWKKCPDSKQDMRKSWDFTVYCTSRYKTV